MPPGRAPAPLGLASPASALFEREVGDGLSTGPRSPATRWAGRVRLSGNGFGRIRLPCAKAHPRKAAFDVAPIAHAAEQLGRPVSYPSPSAQNKWYSLFLILFPVNFKNP